MGQVLHGKKIDTAAVDLSWLRGHRFVDVEWHNPLPWTFFFDDGTRITVECPWRILKASAIAVSSEDHLQKYGLPEPIDVVAQARALLSAGHISEVTLSDGTLDLSFAFSNGLILQLIPFFTGYDCWLIRSASGLNFWGMPGGGVSTCQE
jgi:hypothetical protein